MEYDIGLSDQGNYMSRALNLFGGISKLSVLLTDNRVTAIMNEFSKHHRTGESAAYDARYRRALTLDDMKKVVVELAGKSRKIKKESIDYVDSLVKELISLGAIHSGYVLSCAQCSLEEWYPIDEVGESFRCHRCLAREVRPPSPSIFFRLNEALHQAYMHNFTVPTLVLELLRKSCNTSFIFSPQIKLRIAESHSPELDIVAVCDGQLMLGEAKSNDKIEKAQFDVLESTALLAVVSQVI